MAEFVTAGLDCLIDVSEDNQVSQTVLRIGDAVGVGLVLPAAWTGAGGLGFVVSPTRDGTFVDLYDDGGTIINVPVTASRNVSLQGDLLQAVISWDFVKIKAVDAQAGDRTITVVKKIAAA